MQHHGQTLLVLFLTAFLLPGFWTLVLFFLLFGWSRTTRLVRSQVLSERHHDHVEAAVAVGAGDLRILLRHLLPGMLLLGIHGQHFHLVCRSCGKIIGVEPDAMQAFTRQTGEDYGFQIDLEHLTIPGLCSTCTEAPMV